MYESTGMLSKYYDKKKEDGSRKNTDVRRQCLKIKHLSKTMAKHGVHSTNYLSAAGFQYTGDGDTTRCHDCGLEISNWTLDMNPFDIHSKQKPNCSFIHSMKTSTLISHTDTPLMTKSSNRRQSLSDGEEKPLKRQKVETTDPKPLLNTLVETDGLQQVRRRTFSHWPSRIQPSSSQMIEAGFFSCNVGDRVICLYCNLICQQWTPHVDDPCEVHKTLSPNCIYVKRKLVSPATSSVIIVNETSTTTISTNLDRVRSNQIVFTAACNPAYVELPKRYVSFSTWSNENAPSIDDLVRAGFFYTGTKNIVTCFYCNGSLQNWGPNDNPMIEHARWFPHCAYAKQLCGDELYRKIQESKRVQQERARTNAIRNDVDTEQTANNGQLLVRDETTLSRFVAARLDLPVSQRLLDQNFKLSIIKRCWEDQLRLKHDDFVSDLDLFMACTILQKQIQYIDGKKENIIIPSIKMRQIKEQSEVHAHPQTSNASNDEITTLDGSTIANKTEATMDVDQRDIKMAKSSSCTTNHADQSATNTNPENPCVLCLAEEKRLACIPCGHLATCVPCGHSLRSCPICRRAIEAFVRIYI